jgi:hypothetical protein
MMNISVAKQKLRSHRNSINFLGDEVINRTSIVDAEITENQDYLQQNHQDRRIQMPSVVPPPPLITDPGMFINVATKDQWTIIKLAVTKKKLRSHSNSVNYLEDIDLRQNSDKCVSKNWVPTPPPIPEPRIFPSEARKDHWNMANISAAKKRLRSHRNSIKYLEDVNITMQQPISQGTSWQQEDSNKVSSNSVTSDWFIPAPPPISDPGVLINETTKDYWNTINISIAKKKLKSHRNSINYLGAEVLKSRYMQPKIEMDNDSDSPPPPPVTDPEMIPREVKKDYFNMVQISVAKKRLKSHRNSIKFLGEHYIFKRIAERTKARLDDDPADTTLSPAESDNDDSDLTNPLATKISTDDEISPFHMEAKDNTEFAQNVYDIYNPNLKDDDTNPDQPEQMSEAASDTPRSIHEDDDLLLTQIDAMLDDHSAGKETDIQNGSAQHFMNNGLYLYEL